MSLNKRKLEAPSDQPDETGLEAYRSALALQKAVVKKLGELCTSDARRDKILHAKPEDGETILEAQQRVARGLKGKRGHRRRVRQPLSK